MQRVCCTPAEHEIFREALWGEFLILLESGTKKVFFEKNTLLRKILFMKRILTPDSDEKKEQREIKDTFIKTNCLKLDFDFDESNLDRVEFQNCAFTKYSFTILFATI